MRETLTVLDIADELCSDPVCWFVRYTTFKARKREVYLPATSGWYDLLSGKYFEGGKTYAAEAPLEKIPVFAREGAIMPHGSGHSVYR